MIHKKRFVLRQWFYLRTGYALYWSFLIAGINTLTVTYFLAIDRAPFLQVIFPSFLHYVGIIVAITIPVLILTGLVHFKKIPAFKSEVEVQAEANPYYYKLPPGYWMYTIMPYYRLQSEILIKLVKGEKLTQEESNKMEKLQNDMDTLVKGGYVGDPDRLKSLRSKEG